MDFPLEQWFYLSKRIPQEDVEITEAQLMLYAVKQDMDPDVDEARAVIRSMRKAVKAHNKKLAAK